ncbi:MAG: Phosphate-specific transport system accessory protein PhoU [Clostridia bacterium 41_269]|nr:MAG: Phosphate-specific transport system accessory protein PhoU [Clostridia bacterium 41_269]
MRSSFRRELELLQNSILKMGSMVADALDNAMTALKQRDMELAQRVIAEDDKIDALELEIEQKSLSLIALQQPMAGDLRFLGTALKIITDLERIGDNALSLAKVTINLGNQPFIKPLIDLPRMAEICQKMIRDNLQAFVNRDHELAVKTAELDHEIDHLYNQIFRELLVLMGEDPRNIRQSTYLLLAARHLERIGDHATNISEWIVYMVTGNRVDLNK